MPCAWARSMIAWESSSEVCGPKFIVPRQSRLTLRPVRPSCAYSMFLTLGTWSALQSSPARDRVGRVPGSRTAGHYGGMGCRAGAVLIRLLTVVGLVVVWPGAAAPGAYADSGGRAGERVAAGAADHGTTGRPDGSGRREKP